MDNHDAGSSKDEKPDQEKVKTLLPSQIAKIGSLAKTREFLGDTMEHHGDERTGQLSPPHTPGRGR